MPTGPPRAVPLPPTPRLLTGAELRREEAGEVGGTSFEALLLILVQQEALEAFKQR